MKEKFANVSAEIHHFERWINETNPVVLRETFKELLEQAGFTIVNFTEHHFPVRGYTCVWLLAESHLAIHTFPADGKSFVQLSSCNKSKREAFEEMLNEHQAVDHLLFSNENT